MFFISNVYEVNQECIGWTWYLSCDMQYFLTLPFLIYAFCVKKGIGYLITLGLIGANILITFFISYHFNAGINIITDMGMNAEYIYFKPWC